jgi:hypothetical protein
MNTRHLFALLCILLSGLLSLPSACANILAAGSWPAPGSIRSAGSHAVLSNTRSSALDFVAGIEGSVTAVAVSGTLAYIGAGSSLIVLDIGNPAQPNRLARLVLGGGDIYDLQVAGNRAQYQTGFKWA